ncbi:hypothetical protein OROMI_008354 [Orobanche minor]
MAILSISFLTVYVHSEKFEVLWCMHGVVKFALMLSQMEGGCPVDYSTPTDLFLQRNMIPEATTFLLDVLKPNLAEHAFVQTKFIEINLMTFQMLLMLSWQMARPVTMTGLTLHNYVRKLVFMCEHFSCMRLYDEIIVEDIGEIMVDIQYIEDPAPLSIT